MKHGLLSNPFDVLQVDIVPVVRSQEYVLGDYVRIHSCANRQCPTGDGARLVKNLVSDFLPIHQAGLYAF